MEAKEIYIKLDNALTKDRKYLEGEFSNIRAGKASVGILNGITVESYGSQMPIDQVASVTVPDAKTVLIQAWDKSVISSIEKAIMNANIGVTPSNNGDTIRLSLPPLTEERRRDLSKQVKALGENGKVNVRNIRRDHIEMFKKAKKDGDMNEDMVKDGEAEIQKMIDKSIKHIDDMVVVKEKEVMTV